jgi:thiol-disulfide isomerase/thioredoxin
MNQIIPFSLLVILLVAGKVCYAGKVDLRLLLDEEYQLPYDSGKVRISGKLVNFPNNVEIEDFSNTQGFSPCPSERIIIADAEGNFDIVFSLDSPKYFRIGRNVLYLSPGDELKVVLDKDNFEQSEFSGSGTAVNNYLRKTPFPKGGSFLKAGSNIYPSATKTIEVIEQLADERSRELDAVIKGFPKDVAALEKANIIAHQLNSYFALNSYVFSKIKDETLIKSFLDSVKILTKDKIGHLFEKINNADNLQLVAFRDILYKMDINISKQTSETQKLKDWLKAKNLSSKLNSIQDRDNLNVLKSSVDSLNSEVYKILLLENLHTKLTFLPGDKAKDFEVVLPDGMKTHLSNLKGKVIYIDIWATWCGPCMAEMPHLEKLKEKYKGNQDIVIVSLSIDDTDKIWLKNLEKRKPGGTQWRIERSKLSDYNVTSIPRCIVIDKNFDIVSLNAPNPSDASISKMLETLANNNLKN